ncbi:4Fe-4S binding protein [Vibrio sinensis]|nr:4Fe-4S binding protein [Vibrio sinensis]
MFENNCSRLISGWCNNCSIQCPTQAIVFNGNQPKVVNELCNGCGRCRMACPVNAITFSLAEIR